ncbi:hypothetical protein E4L95_07500 [Paracoccus liaowanqingii]|uniref:Uncharacterized protein n=1 Tax=Paracoccus liaowanqingii TaxID=2560053 RepID=A0A4Z1BXC4_9RHOB|nr:hypothetical protein [Paracoccus liaowanqingii]TGN62213.1 hypothetical protein E4L95_07500 [Paracoccus liaowanqingii]
MLDIVVIRGSLGADHGTPEGAFSRSLVISTAMTEAAPHLDGRRVSGLAGGAEPQRNLAIAPLAAEKRC